MRHRRTIALAIAVLLPVVATAAPAGAAGPGVGTSSGGAEILHLRLGDGALDVRVGTETSATTNDTSSGPASALERLVPLTVSSSLLPALGSLSTPPIEASSTDGERTAGTPAVDLGALAAAGPVPGLLDGTVHGLSLRALVDAVGAVAEADGGITDVSVLGGLLRLGELHAVVGSDALVDGASSGRALTLDRVEVLDLDALLQLLGIGVEDLPLATAAGLLQSLGLALPGGAPSPDALVATVEGLLAQAGAAPAQISALRGQITGSQAQLATLQADLATYTAAAACSLLDPLPILGALTCAQVQSLVLTVQGQIATVNGQIAALTAQLDGLLATLAGVFQPVLDIVGGLTQGLLGAPLVVVEDLEVGVLAAAVDTVDGSAAEVTGSIGAVRIGNLPAVTGVDALALADQATAALGGVLAVVDPALGGLVDIDLLTKASSVRDLDGTTVAEAALTALTLRITPPDLCAVLGRLGGVTPTIGGVLTQAGQALPALPVPVGDVLAGLGSTLSCSGSATGQAFALTQPLSVDVLSMSAKGAFAAVPTQVPTTGSDAPRPGTTPLPRTGAELPLALAAVALVVGVALRRTLARI